MSGSSSQLSASVTRILSLSSFPAELKTRDLVNAFAPYIEDKGGFKLKWVDDTNALVVFADATVAKKAYLQSLLNPHPSLVYPATIRPYDGPDAQAIIASVNARTGAPAGAGHRMNGRGSSVSGMGSFQPPSSSVSPPPANLATSHHRAPSFGHSRMGSIGSGQSSWALPSSSTQAGGPGGAEQALVEVRRALGLGPRTVPA